MPLVQVCGPPLQAAPEPGLVRLLCGVAGSGKTTYAQQLEEQGFVRLSIDEEIWARSGRYGVDYPPEDYPRLQVVAEGSVRRSLVDLMQRRTPVVLDLSLWRRTERDRYKDLVDQHGCSWELVHLQVDEPTLRARLAARAERFDANAAFAISDARLRTFLEGFEVPHGEGEAVLRWEPA